MLHVNALVIRPQHLTDDIFTTSTLLPDEEVDLSFETSRARSCSIDFEEGTPVKKGQLLAKVNDKPLQAQLSEVRGSESELAEDRVYRQSTLLEKDAVSQEAYEQARTELATLNADIELCEADIALTELRAPVRRDHRSAPCRPEGAYASPTVVAAKLTRIAPLKIEFGVPERYASEIRPGTPLSFTVEGSLETFRAKVYAVDPNVDEQSRTLSVRALYPNDGQHLFPGRFASIRIQISDIPRGDRRSDRGRRARDGRRQGLSL